MKMQNHLRLKKQGFKYVCGVDEAGRGPIAGPLSLSFFCVPIETYKQILNPLLKNGLNDSKKIKESNREKIFNLLQVSDIYLLKNKTKNVKKPISNIKYSQMNSMISAQQIDKLGVSKCYQVLINRLLKKLSLNIDLKKTYFLLDGAIKFPAGISHKVIIGGDSIEPTIMAASVVSKVKRDRYMQKISKKFPKYEFQINKGYGTKRHRDAIKEYGLSRLHRKTFCKAFTK